MEDMRGTPWTIAFGEPRDSTVVQQFDPLDGAMDAIAVADGEAREALVFFIPRGYLFPCLLLKAFESLVEVGDSLRILFLFLMMDPIPLADGLYKLLGEVAEPDQVVDIEPLNDVSGRGRGDGVSAGDGHEDSGRGTG